VHEASRPAAEELVARLAGRDASCTYVAAVALVRPDGRWWCVRGQARGSLVAPRGDGPGHAPAFQPAGETQTWAELGPAWRRAHDHRADALHRLIERLSTALSPA